MKRKFQDSAIAPIIAWDFDDTININGGHKYPECGEIRKYTREIINLLHDIGVKNIIWTSRDVAYVQEEGMIYDDLTPAIKFLDDNDIHYDAINKSVQFSPWHVNSRKVYAHMYVDDRAFGWAEHCDQDIMLCVLESIFITILGINDDHLIRSVFNMLINDDHISEGAKYELSIYVKHWKD